MMKQKKSDQLDLFLGTRLKQLRIRRKLSMAQVGEVLEVNPQQISRYESGQHRMTASALFRLARGLDMPLAWFFEGFQEESNELGRLRNVIREPREAYNPATDQDQEAALLSLWKSLPKAQQRQQIIHLMEAFV